MLSRPWIGSDSVSMAFGIEGSLNYGILMGQERFVLTPYLQSRSHAERDHRFGLRLQGIRQYAQPLELKLMIRRLDQIHDEPNTDVLFAATWRL